MEFLLLDVSFGFFDLIFMKPITDILAIGLAVLLISLGVRAIRRELAKKKGLPGELAPMIESEDPETAPLPEAEAQAAETLGEAAAPAEAGGEENKTE